MNICVTGGAGYIGSFIVRRLCELGHRVTVVDDLSKGHLGAVDPQAHFIQGDCGDRSAMTGLLTGRRIEAVVHMAASSSVGESTCEPDRYYRNNVVASLNLTEAMIAANIRRIVFSSTAAVYGQPQTQPITEDCPLQPINPYGRTKMIVELALGDLASAGRLGAVSLRYFNVAGGSPDGALGEDHDPESHLVPLALAAAAGRGGPLTVFGDDYPTPDGTCIRDYVHVLDLAEAHVMAVDAVEPDRLKVYNLGNGQGYSVMQVIEAAERVVGGADRPGLKLPRRVGPRRPGDPPVLVASAKKIGGELGWAPVRADLELIIDDAWAFHRAHPDGYED